MFFVLAGIVIAAPHVLNVANRVLEEIVIPRQEMKALKRRRAQQAAAGVPEEKRETPNRVVYVEINGQHLDCELMDHEVLELRKIGAFDILARGARRRPHAAKADKAQQEAA